MVSPLTLFSFLLRSSSADSSVDVNVANVCLSSVLYMFVFKLSKIVYSFLRIVLMFAGARLGSSPSDVWFGMTSVGCGMSRLVCCGVCDV